MKAWRRGFKGTNRKTETVAKAYHSSAESTARDFKYHYSVLILNEIFDVIK